MEIARAYEETYLNELVAYQIQFDGYTYERLSRNEATPSSLMDSTKSPNVKIREREGVGACSLAHNTLGVEGHVGALRWGLGRLISNSITHTHLHNPNNKMVSA